MVLKFPTAYLYHSNYANHNYMPKNVLKADKQKASGLGNQACCTEMFKATGSLLRTVTRYSYVFSPPCFRPVLLL